MNPTCQLRQWSADDAQQLLNAKGIIQDVDGECSLKLKGKTRKGFPIAAHYRLPLYALNKKFGTYRKVVEHLQHSSSGGAADMRDIYLSVMQYLHSVRIAFMDNVSGSSDPLHGDFRSAALDYYLWLDHTSGGFNESRRQELFTAHDVTFEALENGTCSDILAFFDWTRYHKDNCQQYDICGAIQGCGRGEDIESLLNAVDSSLDVTDETMGTVAANDATDTCPSDTQMTLVSDPIDVHFYFQQSNTAAANDTTDTCPSDTQMTLASDPVDVYFQQSNIFPQFPLPFNVYCHRIALKTLCGSARHLIISGFGRWDVRRRCKGHANPAITGSIMSFIESVDDPSKIQGIPDIPLAHIGLPDGLRDLDHGLVHGWNETTHSVPITSNIHPANFTTKGSALLHHAGFLTYPRHDAEGMLTWVKIESGLKFWVIFSLKSGETDRIHLQDLAVKLSNFTKHKTWLEENCAGEVITLRPGDLLIMPPGMVHAVYTPVMSFAIGGHFYNYCCMHLTEISRYIDTEVRDRTTNEVLDHALETLRRMVIVLPFLSSRITLYKRSLLSLCIMAKKGHHYRALGSSEQSVEDTETCYPSVDISEIICEFLGVSGHTRVGDLLYVGNQFDTGPKVDRQQLAKVLRDSLAL